MKAYFGTEKKIDVSKLKLPEGVVKYRLKIRVDRFATITLQFEDRFEHWGVDIQENGDATPCYMAGITYFNNIKKG